MTTTADRTETRHRIEVSEDRREIKCRTCNHWLAARMMNPYTPAEVTSRTKAHMDATAPFEAAHYIVRQDPNDPRRWTVIKTYPDGTEFDYHDQDDGLPHRDHAERNARLLAQPQ